MVRSTGGPLPRSGSTPPSPPRRPVTPRRVPAIDQHAPVRSCVGCRQRRPQSELVRVTRTVGDAGSTISVDGPSSGRGAWLCRAIGNDIVIATCLDDALSRNQFGRAWRSQLDHHDVEAIRAALRPNEEHTD